MKQAIVYVVDDDDAFRESLVWLLEGAAYQVRAFASAEAFLQACNEFDAAPFGCLLLDVRMTGMSGLTLQQQLLQRGIKLPVIIITGHADVAMAVQAMKNQAVDFIEKPFDDQLLLALLEQVLGNLAEPDPASQAPSQLHNNWASLSKREKDVARLVIAGKVNREIAEQLGISIKTVEIHRSRVMHKMQARNLAELVKQAADIAAYI